MLSWLLDIFSVSFSVGVLLEKCLQFSPCPLYGLQLSIRLLDIVCAANLKCRGHKGGSVADLSLSSTCSSEFTNPCTKDVRSFMLLQVSEAARLFLN